MIGDVLTSSLLFEALRSKYPDAELHYLIKRNTFPVVKSNPYIDKIIFDREDQFEKKLNFLFFMSRLRKEHYHAVIDVYSKIGSALLTYGTNAHIRVGRKKWYTWFLYTVTIPYKKSLKSIVGKAIKFRMDLLRPLGITGDGLHSPKILLSQEEREDAKTFIKKSGVDLNKTLVMCSVLGSGVSKTYPLKYFAEVLETVISAGDVELLFNYMPSQYDYVEQLLEFCSDDVRKKVKRSCYATNLRQFIAITSFCDMLIGNEGGAVHMAKAVGVPTFAIFSPQITKDAWFNRTSIKDEAVHLRDYEPEVFEQYPDRKQILSANGILYKLFKPNLFKNLLNDFVNKNLKR